MFVSSRTPVYEALQKLLKNICSYGGGKVCDCKYGFSSKGEQTGCPELRCALEVLRLITDEEYENIITRSPNNTITDK